MPSSPSSASTPRRRVTAAPAPAPSPGSRPGTQAPSPTPTPTPTLEERALALVPALLKDVLLTQRYLPHVAACVLAFDAVLTVGIIWRVPYTEIDFSTYMEQASLFLSGQRDYTLIEGSTGPCVYPAGHLYLYAAVHSLTRGGARLRLAQYLFAGVYLVSQAAIISVYGACGAPAVLLPLLALSKRLHSIFVLRMFNDGPAMALVWCALAALGRRRYGPAVGLTSLALSIKMNVLLLLPALFLVLLRARGLLQTALHAVHLVAIQALLALPFLRANPHAYLARAFDLKRQFLYKWTVNLRFLPEDVFLDARVSIALLALHVLLLALFALFKWTSIHADGPLPWLLARCRRGEAQRLSGSALVLPALTANLLGILCARSLHYQFYAWYAQTLPLLLHSARVHSRITRWAILPAGIEVAWNTYPSTTQSSLLLCSCNALLLLGLWRRDWRAQETDVDVDVEVRQQRKRTRRAVTPTRTPEPALDAPRTSPRKPKRKTRQD